MPAPEDAVTAVTRALSDVISALDSAPAPADSGALHALQHELNGGAEAHIGAHYADVIVRERGLSANARLLDLGCGYGRVALDLAARLSDDQQYFGLDPHAEAVGWAQRNIGEGRSNFHFELIDVVSKPYNPDGSLSGARFRFPFDDDSLDRVFMISVLTHVDLDTVRNYLEEAARVLKPDTGRLVSTIFLLDQEVDGLIADGRAAYQLRWQIGESRVENRDNPELVIAHPRARVSEILRDAGFADVEIRDGHWSGRPSVSVVDFQDMIVADFGSVEPAPLSADEQVEARELFAVARVLVERGVQAEDVVPGLVWAFSAFINLLRWESQGIEILRAGSEDLQGRGWDLTQMRRVDFRACIFATAPVGEYVPVEEAAILAAIRGVRPHLTRPELVDMLAEAVRGGVALDHEVRAGRVHQRMPSRVVRIAPLPAL